MHRKCLQMLWNKIEYGHQKYDGCCNRRNRCSIVTHNRYQNKIKNYIHSSAECRGQHDQFLPVNGNQNIRENRLYHPEHDRPYQYLKHNWWICKRRTVHQQYDFICYEHRAHGNRQCDDYKIPESECISFYQVIFRSFEVYRH